MPSPVMNVLLARAAERLPGLRRLPLARLVILAELAFLARQHYERLSPRERRQLVLLAKQSRGRPSNLSDRERREFENLIARIEPKILATEAVNRLLPLNGKRRAG